MEVWMAMQLALGEIVTNHILGTFPKQVTALQEHTSKQATSIARFVHGVDKLICMAMHSPYAHAPFSLLPKKEPRST